MRVRGLKHIIPSGEHPYAMSHPVRVRGLKRIIAHYLAICESRTRAGCVELAQSVPELLMPDQESHPVRVRGLKLGGIRWTPALSAVAPRAGAWVENCRHRVKKHLQTPPPPAGVGGKAPQGHQGRVIVAPRAGAWS